MTFAENISIVREEINKTCREFARDPDDVRLIAVSKTQSDDKIEEALAAGQLVFGENRVQEAQARWAGRREKYPDLQLHLIGPLQTNKVKEAVALFDVIHTLDREKLAMALQKEMGALGRQLPCLIQVNTGGEDQKSGIEPRHVPEFLAFCRHVCVIDVRGLMCIPPVEDTPALHFALLKKLAVENDLVELSMGMSGDFEKAIPLGATYIRVGTRLFGDRS